MKRLGVMGTANELVQEKQALSLSTVHAGRAVWGSALGQSPLAASAKSHGEQRWFVSGQAKRLSMKIKISLVLDLQPVHVMGW